MKALTLIIITIVLTACGTVPTINSIAMDSSLQAVRLDSYAMTIQVQP